MELIHQIQTGTMTSSPLPDAPELIDDAPVQAPGPVEGNEAP